MSDFQIDPNHVPEWQRPIPDIIEKIRQLHESFQKEEWARSPRNVIFEYSSSVPPERGYIMDRQHFEDGRYRVFLHPDHQTAVEGWLEGL